MEYRNARITKLHAYVPITLSGCIVFQSEAKVVVLAGKVEVPGDWRAYTPEDVAALATEQGVKNRVKAWVEPEGEKIDLEAFARRPS